MSEKKTIRIVKKGKSSRTDKSVGHSDGVATRTLVGTVTNWVTEFQLKRRNETANALKILSKRHREAN